MVKECTVLWLSVLFHGKRMYCFVVVCTVSNVLFCGCLYCFMVKECTVLWLSVLFHGKRMYCFVVVCTVSW